MRWALISTCLRADGMQNLTAIAVLLVSSLTSAAQVRGAIGSAAARPGHGGPPVRSIVSLPEPTDRHFRPLHSHRFFQSGLVFPGFFDSDPVVVEPPSPTVVVVTPAPLEKVEPPRVVEPLLLELHGDRWVRVGQGSDQQGQSIAVPVKTKSNTSAKEVPAPRPAAVLVFRDRHREEVAGYTIMQGALYAAQDYWTTGSWTRKVMLADLDLPETIRSNQQRGVKFVLPSAPNEVVVRP
jgi:hypothetical protein